jgi:hypothetical protein
VKTHTDNEPIYLGTTRKALRAFAQWLEDSLEIIHPKYPEGRMMRDGDLQAWADRYWTELKKENS